MVDLSYLRVCPDHEPMVKIPKSYGMPIAGFIAIFFRPGHGNPRYYNLSGRQATATEFVEWATSEFPDKIHGIYWASGVDKV